MSKTIVIGASQSNVDVDLVDNLSQAGIIESQDGGDLLTFKTTDGSEAVIVGGDGAKLSVNQASPTAQIHAKSVADVAMTGGTVSTSGSPSTNLAGSGTSFRTDFAAGSSILIGTDARTVNRVNSDTLLELTANVTADDSTVAKKDRSLIKLERSNGETGFEVTAKGRILVLNGNGEDDNIVIGSSTTMPGNGNGTAQRNVAIGPLALGSHVGSTNSVGVGRGALANGDASHRVGVGYSTGGSTGGVAVGYQAGVNSGGAASYNTLLGYQAGDLLTTGNQNVVIGGTADVDANDDVNSVVIGYGTAGLGDNSVALGNTSMTAIKGQVAFATYSDSRIKTNVTDCNAGLELIKALRPVEYDTIHPSEWPDEIRESRFQDHTNDEGVTVPADTKPEGWEPAKRIGLIAQELEAVLTAQNIECDLVQSNPNGLKSVQYANLIMPLIRAVKELDSRLAALEGGS